MKLLTAYTNPEAQATLIGRDVALAGAVAVAAALVTAHNEEQLTASERRRAADVCRAFWRYAGIVQEAGRAERDIGQDLALARLKQALRDAALVIPWPYNTGGDALHVALTPHAQEALRRLLQYDPLDGPALYPGSAGSDAAALAAGTTLVRVRDGG